MLVAPKPLDSDFIAEARHHDLAVLGILGGLHCEQITVHDAGVPHGHAAHLQKVVWLALKQAAFDVIGLVDVFLGQDG